MSEVVPFLRLTASEIDCIRRELQPCIEIWSQQWCTTPLESELEPVDLESLPVSAYALRWGTGDFWVGSAAADSFDSLLSLACFEQAHTQTTPIHPLTRNVFLKARAALFATLLNQEKAASLAAATPVLRGRSLRLRLYTQACEVCLILSPSLLFDILENRFYRTPADPMPGIQRALAPLPVRLTAVVGAATVALTDFMALEAGDVVALDPAENPSLMGCGGAIAHLAPCRLNNWPAVRIENFLTDRKMP